ncbi:hypothetical protein [Humibacter ginsenosidimutans]|uniref:Uncharacterized protein n=1 Tax=Humibacter ginsenosidimutans TaxID=2599293 RepID=A0A5B8M642_9MICO|nr:hypothetical protein [Humibacter ginsenosidimutans]QDZ15444.1 hypothetical protein FPZ11_12375 [Humibacter ginsenosidimutans]
MTVITHSGTPLLRPALNFLNCLERLSMGIASGIQGVRAPEKIAQCHRGTPVYFALSPAIL